MTTHERFARMYAHQEADRVPFCDYPWAGTLQRWHREGLPEGIDWIEYFDLDHVAGVGVDISPQYPQRVIEETDEYIISTTPWGVTLKNQKQVDSTPEFLDFTVADSIRWSEAKARMTPDPSRIPWAYLQQNYRRWREQGAWLQAQLWFGFDVTHSWFVGTETLLMALLEEPEWCADMFDHYLDMCIALFDQVIDAGYTFDEVTWPDDMGYKNTQFFSLEIYRELVKPVQKRAIEWAHSRGMKTHLHSCGNINPFVPELIELGLDALNPLEVKAGMDPYALKKQYGNRLVLHGGMNAQLWDDRKACEAELRRLIPVMKQNGGYVFASDHSIPSSVSFADIQYILRLAKELCRYD